MYTAKEFKNTEGGVDFEAITLENSVVTEFIIKWNKIEFHYVDFSIYEVTSWDGDNPSEYEIYISGSIKWDGCSNIHFGDESGYIHLCGKHYFDKHCKLLQAVWNICSKRIKAFDHNVAS